MGAQAPAVILVGAVWATATWVQPALPAAALALVLAFSFLASRGGLGEVPWRGLLALAMLGFLAHLLGTGGWSVRLTGGLSAALRLDAILLESRAIYGMVGPAGIARALGRLAEPFRAFGVRPQDLEIMGFVTLRMIPEAARSARSVWNGRRYLSGRSGPRAWVQLAGAWVGATLRTAGAVAEALVLRGLGERGTREPVDWRGLRLLWLPALSCAFALAGHLL